MSEFERTRAMPAMPEVVFNEACDLGHLGSWLPGDVHVRPQNPPSVTVHEDRTGEDAAALVRTEPDRLRMEWGTKEAGRYTGWLQVSAHNGGVSQVTVHLTFFDESHAPEPSAIEEALEQSLARLEEQVRLRGPGPEGPG
ncbi:SRPBCC family protein [Streptomyces orinoci]|uniref:SRPBCC family protein n=1 Tax=Streptomyces orinoci TaxID=67339 RepID=A0ABV3JQF2_STRON|nr:SRPBCC family protein [Streptomyces orinoci]